LGDGVAPKVGGRTPVEGNANSSFGFHTKHLK
jgi:hypothetical protein